MLLNIAIVIGGLLLITFGADLLTKGSIQIALRMGISELVVGLTVVAIGTSTPEIAVSIASAFKGQSQMAIGNVVGSNIFNTLLVVGVVALYRPIPLDRDNIRKNIPQMIVATAMLLFATLHLFGIEAMPNEITQVGGVILLASFIYFIWISIKGSGEGQREREQATMKISTSILFVVAGLSALIYGGDIFLENIIVIAREVGIEEYVISATIMAAGTSLPELAACIAAARAGRSQLVMGNIIGSNISNILLVLGATAAISPLKFVGVSAVDISVVVISSLLLMATPFTFKKSKVDRVEGAIMVALYCGYVYWLLVK